VTLLWGSLTTRFRGFLAVGPYADEFAAIATPRSCARHGHWPQFSAPDRLASAIVDAITR
jgi:hypothetical protein